MAAFLLPKTQVPLNHGRNMVPTTADVRTKLGGGQVYGPLEAAAVDAATAARVLHWPLAFPDVMVERGGFDVVLGNPPWERIKLQEQEFFAGTAVADAPNAAARTRMIDALPGATLPSGEPDLAARALHAAFQTAKRVAEATSAFARVPGDEGGRYAYTGTGDVNTYALFAELSFNLRQACGRVGIIVPSELLSSDANKTFFQALISQDLLRQSLAFENEEFIFPGIANVNRFALLTLGEKNPRRDDDAEFAFYLRNATHIEELSRRFSLMVEDFALLNPNTLTCPVFRTKYDAELTRAIYRRLPVIEREGRLPENPWSVEFHRMFDMANDSDKFISEKELDCNEDVVPLYEGKFIWHYDHRFSSYHNLGIVKGRGGRGLPPTSADEYADPNFEVKPRYWMPRDVVDKRISELGISERWLLGWRDVANAKVERTMVCSFIPYFATNHKLPIIASPITADKKAVFMANLASVPFDYVARQKMGGTSFAYFYLKQLPILPPSAYTEAYLAFIVPRVLELSYTSHAMAAFARDLGYDGAPFAWDEDRRAQLRAELDAWYALAYGLTRDELRYVLDPKDVMGADYPSETFRVLQKNEIAKFGEYRTRRLVLAAYDAQVAAGARPRVEGYR